MEGEVSGWLVRWSGSGTYIPPWPSLHVYRSVLSPSVTVTVESSEQPGAQAPDAVSHDIA
jgi:hypothetical protein